MVNFTLKMVKRILSVNHFLKFFLSKRGFSLSHGLNSFKVENLLIIGSGLMGSGVAQASASSNFSFNSIVLQDIDQAALDKAKSKMYANLVKMKKKNSNLNENEVMSKVTFTTSMEPKSTQNLLVLEAVTENLELKQKLFQKLDAQFDSDSNVILATNTSSFCCGEIFKYIKSLDRCAGLHFFNPVPLMKLVEVVRLDKGTNDDTFLALNDYCKNINKVPVTCKDTPGFIVNRLLLPYLFEALEMLERGDASICDIDKAMKLGAGYPMGPFELLDYVGLDTTQFIGENWNKRIGFKKSKLLEEMVKRGELGKKSGKGFYNYK